MPAWPAIPGRRSTSAGIVRKPPASTGRRREGRPGRRQSSLGWSGNFQQRILSANWRWLMGRRHLPAAEPSPGKGRERGSADGSSAVSSTGYGQAGREDCTRRRFSLKAWCPAGLRLSRDIRSASSRRCFISASRRRCCRLIRTVILSPSRASVFHFLPVEVERHGRRCGRSPAPGFRRRVASACEGEPMAASRSWSVKSSRGR